MSPSSSITCHSCHTWNVRRRSSSRRASQEEEEAQDPKAQNQNVKRKLSPVWFRLGKVPLYIWTWADLLLDLTTCLSKNFVYLSSSSPSSRRTWSLKEKGAPPQRHFSSAQGRMGSCRARAPMYFVRTSVRPIRILITWLQASSKSWDKFCWDSC